MVAVIHFTLEGAKDVEDTDTFSKPDVYAVITYGKHKTKSEVAKDGVMHGFKYTWNQTFQFDEDPKDNDVDVKLYDKDIGLDDFIGSAKFTLTKARAQGSANEAVHILTKGREEKGTLTAKIVFSQRT